MDCSERRSSSIERVTSILACPKCRASLKATWNACPECGSWISDLPRPLPAPWTDIGTGPVLDDARERERVEMAKKARDRRLRSVPIDEETEDPSPIG